MGIEKLLASAIIGGGIAIGAMNAKANETYQVAYIPTPIENARTISDSFYDHIKGNLNPDITKRFINPKKLDEVITQGYGNPDLNFHKIDPKATKELYELSRIYDIHPSLIFSMGLVESNLDRNNPLQIIDDNISHYYGLAKERAKKDQRLKPYMGNRNYLASMELIAEYGNKLGLDVSKQLSPQETIMFLGAYNAGISKFLKDPETVLYKFKVTNAHVIKVLSTMKNYDFRYG